MLLGDEALEKRLLDLPTESSDEEGGATTDNRKRFEGMSGLLFVALWSITMLSLPYFI